MFTLEVSIIKYIDQAEILLVNQIPAGLLLYIQHICHITNLVIAVIY